MESASVSEKKGKRNQNKKQKKTKFKKSTIQKRQKKNLKNLFFSLKNFLYNKKLNRKKIK